MNPFEYRQFESIFILQCVRWYLKYGLSYRDLSEMMKERGIEVCHTTIYRWVIHYSHELKKRSNWYRMGRIGSWRVDETASCGRSDKNARSKFNQFIFQR